MKCSNNTIRLLFFTFRTHFCKKKKKKAVLIMKQQVNVFPIICKEVGPLASKTHAIYYLEVK